MCVRVGGRADRVGSNRASVYVFVCRVVERVEPGLEGGHGHGHGMLGACSAAALRAGGRALCGRALCGLPSCEANPHLVAKLKSLQASHNIITVAGARGRECPQPAIPSPRAVGPRARGAATAAHSPQYAPTPSGVSVASLVTNAAHTENVHAVDQRLTMRTTPSVNVRGGCLQYLLLPAMVISPSFSSTPSGR